MKLRYIAISVCILFSGTLLVKAQERLVSVGSYPALAKGISAISTKSLNLDTLKLPVTDDFSGSSTFPGGAVWTDNLVYVNNSFGLNPPTYGVATFDAMDSTGKIYTTATTESFLADALTSRPVDLFLPLDTTIYLSFFYQPQGFGDAPEPEDSLVVEFWAPDSKRWLRVWSAPGTAAHDFRMAMINITDSRFIQKGFRFRFRNYASLANTYEPSLKVNADQWNIDYVYLNNGRHFNDTIMPDASITQTVGSLLLNHTAMPWEHFKLAGISSVKAVYQINLNNLSADQRNFAPIFKITPVWVAGTGFEKKMPNDLVKAFQTLKYDAAFNYGFTSNETDSALFEVSLDMNQQSPDQIPGNDKAISWQLFSDYYAYDDGSAEAGYGIVGEGTKSARLAYRFKNFNDGDSLAAIDFFFNRSFADAGRKYFTLAIWADNSGEPGDLLYTQTGGVPEYNGINEFQRIKLDTAQVLRGTYYIGWIQTTADFLNVGFDRQNNHGQDIYYKTLSTWQQSSFGGSLMIRPVFLNKSRKSGVDPTEVSQARKPDAKIYPNPANEQVRIDCDDQARIIRVSVTDLQGRLVRNYLEAGPSCKISVADISKGIYIIGVKTDSGLNTRQKLIVIHE